MKLQSLLLLALLAVPAAAMDIPESWTTPVEPFRVAGNIYYVGTAELSSWLIVTPEGYFLLDAPLEENVELILGNIEKLGFDPKKIRVLLNSHAHVDHAGGLAAIKAKTGARLYLSKADAELAARGGRDDFAFGDDAAYPPVTADVILLDGQGVTLGGFAPGGTTLVAYLTPGHTKGNTTWTTRVREGDREFLVVFAPSLSAPGYKLARNDSYPEIVDDYRATFERLGNLADPARPTPDIFLSTHGSFFDLAKKAAALRAGGTENPFVSPDEFREFVDYWRQAFEKSLEKQRDPK
ncbi:MAG: subclass B3 metallo-beta-lactamase [Thermoanaerobaculia bacterium]|nr:subclass B3 metallo-beta-lactamase [Thermoanaerobaculia bacterium]